MIPIAEPRWLSRAMIEAMHGEQVREHGGQHGLRDAGLLVSALARPKHVGSYEPEADLARLAAEYCYGLAKNHPFVDGNKRVALVAMNVFLQVNGYELDAPEPAAVDVIMRVADGRLSAPQVADWVRTVLVPYPG